MTIKKKLNKQTTIKKQTGKEVEVIQESEESPRKVNKPLASNVVGLNVGVTINLGDFQSLRIDCWASEELQPGEDKVDKLVELTELIKEHINYVSQEMQD